MVEDLWQDGGVKNEVKDQSKSFMDIPHTGHEGILFVK